MKWIEMIKIQAASGQGAILNDELTTLVQTMQRHSDCQGLTKIGSVWIEQEEKQL